MSYIRFGEQDSDVYVFLSVDGGLECCGCALSETDVRRLDLDAMLAHLTVHKAAGQTVPDDAIRRLVADKELIRANP